MTFSAYKRALLLGVVLVVLVAGSAEARPFGPVEEAAWQEAVTFWGLTPPLCSSITRELVAPGVLGVDDEGRDVAGRATMPQEKAVACGVWIEEDVPAGTLCSTARHEYGHLLGFGHDDPELALVPRCASPEWLAQRAEAWAVWREWRQECPTMQTVDYRAKCYRSVKKVAARLRQTWASPGPILAPVADY